MDPVSQVIMNPPDMSIQHLVMQADPVVKAVMGLLVIFSVWCWAIIVEKLLEVSKAVRAIAEIEALLMTKNLKGLIAHDGPHPIVGVLQAGTQEWRDGPGAHKDEIAAEARERIERAMRLEFSIEMRRLQKRLPFLATVGSSGPFIGLFGTVYGIMNSFSSIAAAHDTSLAVVAPGIAEALLATAIGLVAAIPAVMAYNKFATDLGALGGRVGTAIGMYGGLISKTPVPAKG
jgi:biopolymer transport protein TolQ